MADIEGMVQTHDGMLRNPEGMGEHSVGMVDNPHGIGQIPAETGDPDFVGDREGMGEVDGLSLQGEP